jgi:hypothetical protein
MDHGSAAAAALLQTRHISALNYISPAIPVLWCWYIYYREPFLNIAARSGERFIASKLNALPVCDNGGVQFVFNFLQIEKRRLLPCHEIRVEDVNYYH